MSEEQWIGVALLLLGAYSVGCSMWARGFFLYHLKARRVAGVFGDKAAHRFDAIFGVIPIGVGLAKSLGIL